MSNRNHLFFQVLTLPPRLVRKPAQRRGVRRRSVQPATPWPRDSKWARRSKLGERKRGRLCGWRNSWSLDVVERVSQITPVTFRARLLWINLFLRVWNDLLDSEIYLYQQKRMDRTFGKWGFHHTVLILQQTIQLHFGKCGIQYSDPVIST